MTELPALVYPPGVDGTSGPAPLIIFLHGSGERGTDPALLRAYGPLAYIDAGHTLPAYIAAPQCPLDHYWADVLDDLDVWLNSLLREYPIDPERLLLTGFSMGSFGAWQWALRHPKRFAALLPVGGNGFRFRGYRLESDLSALAQVPTWMIHGAGDEVVPVSGADDFYQALLAGGAHFGYTRYPDAGHTETADIAFHDRAHYDWLLKQRRQAE